MGSRVIANMAKYSVLDEMLYDYGTSIFVGNTARVIVDLNNIARQLCGQIRQTMVEEDMPTADLVACDIINLIGHYRAYFSRMNKKTVIYVVGVMDTETVATNPVSAAYQAKIIQYMTEVPLFKKVVLPGIQAAMTFCKYVPNVHYYDCISVSPTDVVLHILNDVCKPQDPKVIISSSALWCNFVSKAKVLNVRGFEETFELTRLNFTQVVYPAQVIPIEFDVAWYPYLLAIMGGRELELPNVPKFSAIKAIKLLNDIANNINENLGYYVPAVARYNGKDGRDAGTQLVHDQSDMISILSTIFTQTEMDIIKSNLLITNVSANYVNANPIDLKLFVGDQNSTFIVTKDLIMRAANEIFGSYGVNLTKLFTGEKEWFDKPDRVVASHGRLEDEETNPEDDAFDTKKVYD